MVARPVQTEDRVDRRHSRSENVRTMSAFQLCDGTFQRFPVRMVGPRVVITLVFAKLLIHVRRSLIDRRNDRTRRWIRLLTYVNGVRGKSHCGLLLLREPYRHAAGVLQRGNAAAVPLQCGSCGTSGTSLRLRLSTTCRADSFEVTGPNPASQTRRKAVLRGIHRLASLIRRQPSSIQARVCILALSGVT